VAVVQEFGEPFQVVQGGGRPLEFHRSRQGL
jgi:hypothetical protein